MAAPSDIILFVYFYLLFLLKDSAAHSNNMPLYIPNESLTTSLLKTVIVICKSLGALVKWHFDWYLNDFLSENKLIHLLQRTHLCTFYCTITVHLLNLIISNMLNSANKQKLCTNICSVFSFFTVEDASTYFYFEKQ